MDQIMPMNQTKRKSLSLELINAIYANLPIPKQCELLALNRRVFEMRNGPVKRSLKNWKHEFAKFTRTYFGDEEYGRMWEHVEVKLSTHDVLGTDCGNLQRRQQLLVKEIDQNIEWVRRHFRVQKCGDKEFEQRLKERNFDLSVQIASLSSRIHEEGCLLKMWENLQRKYAAEGQNNGSNKINSFQFSLPIDEIVPKTSTPIQGMPRNDALCGCENGRMEKGQKAYDTPDSQDVSVPSTKGAQRCLTCQIGRDGVLSTRYGRKRPGGNGKGYLKGKGRGKGERGKKGELVGNERKFREI